MGLLADLVMSVQLPLVNDNRHDSLITMLQAVLLLLTHLHNACLAEDQISLDLQLFQVVEMFG